MKHLIDITEFSTPELDERLDTAVTILDTDERNAAAMELQDYVMAELCASAPVAIWRIPMRISPHTLIGLLRTITMKPVN